MQDCGRVREDIEAYVLGALDAVSGRRVETHINECSSCRDIVRSYVSTIDELPFSVSIVKAPPRLKERVLGSVGALRPIVTPVSLVRASRWWAAAAAVFLAFGIGGVVWAIIMSQQVDRLRQDNAHLAELTQLDAQQRAQLLQIESEVSRAKTQQAQLENTVAEQGTLLVLALDPDVIPTELIGTSIAPNATCRYVWSTKQSLGGLTCAKLPAISFTLSYQLWVVRGDKATSMGTFTPRADGSAQLLYKPSGEGGGAGGPITSMFVTLETAAPVSRQPSAEVVLSRAPEEQAAR
jgi:anti-sigma-K factor RskA